MQRQRYSGCSQHQLRELRRNTRLHLVLKGLPNGYHTERYESGGIFRPVLHKLLTTHRLELIDRCREKAAKRLEPEAAPAAFQHGVPLFLDQIIKTLQIEQTATPCKAAGCRALRRRTVHVRDPCNSEAARSRVVKGGYTVDQVVHDYGDLCQAITDLAFERHSPIEVDEFRTLNRCLDNGIADAVTEFASRRDSVVSAQSILGLNEQLGSLATTPGPHSHGDRRHGCDQDRPMSG